jgi:S-adenosylmethionine:tRNA ribosyltransferase-isomerase
VNADKGDFCTAEVVSKPGGGRCLLRIEHEGDSGEVLERIGFPPLPPYIKRGDDIGQATVDKERYQTVFAREFGAVAAPTAGLHFTESLIEDSKQQGVHFAFVTLHVGSGTFKTVKAVELDDHEMEAERFSIDDANAELINKAKRNGGRVIAVGTTVVRTLEWVAKDGLVKAGDGATELFVQPGYEFKIVDAMVTNFHLPKSTLLALVGAFAGLENIHSVYRHAVEQRYRFYSYGDAMLIV